MDDPAARINQFKNPSPKTARNEENIWAELLIAAAAKVFSVDPGEEFSHHFRRYTCQHCGAGAVRLDISHYEDSDPSDFKGSVRTCCTQCGKQDEVLRIAGSTLQSGKWVENTSIREEIHAGCACGNDVFYAGLYELYEGDFFDEGAVVGACSRCGENHFFAGLD